MTKQVLGDLLVLAGDAMQPCMHPCPAVILFFALASNGLLLVTLEVDNIMTFDEYFHCSYY